MLSGRREVKSKLLSVKMAIQAWRTKRQMYGQAFLLQVAASSLPTSGHHLYLQGRLQHQPTRSSPSLHRSNPRNPASQPLTNLLRRYQQPEHQSQWRHPATRRATLPSWPFLLWFSFSSLSPSTFVNEKTISGLCNERKLRSRSLCQPILRKAPARYDIQKPRTENYFNRLFNLILFRARIQSDII